MQATRSQTPCSKNRAARPAGARRAYSIVEATLAVILIGGALVAALNVAATASRNGAAATQRRHAERLANSLLAEVLSMPSHGADNTSPSTGPRVDTFDHLLDYDGFTESPPKSFDGTIIGPPGWTWRVGIALRGAETLDSRMVNLNMRRITATVELPDGTTVSARALRGGSPFAQRVPINDSTQTTQVAIRLQLIDGAELFASPSVLGNRPPDAASSTIGVLP